MEERLRILLVDDHSVVRIGLRALLEALPDFTVVGEAGNGQEALELAARHQPDVVLLDLLMPGLSAEETTAGIRQTSPGTKILVLTSHLDDSRVLPILRAGALSYVLKSVQPRELIEAIRKTGRGDAVLASLAVTRVVREVRTPERAPSPLEDLSPRELEVLRLIANGSTNATIASSLFISDKTVKTHVSSILGKLGVSDRTQAAALAWQQGVMSKDE